jgi:hypothetical protein
MKLNKLLVPVAAFALVANVACTDECKYTPAEKPSNAQVYFSTSESQLIDLEENQSSFDLNVYRATDEGQVTVTLTVTQPEDQTIFNIPTQVTFADGSKKSAVHVTYNFADIVPSHSYTIGLAVADADATPYGLSTYSYEISYVKPGDPLRDAVLGNYTGSADGYEYWSASGYSSTFSYTYGGDGVAPVVVRAGEGPTDVEIRGLFPDNTYLSVSNPVGQTHYMSENPDYADYTGYIGYITLPANELIGTYVYYYLGTPYNMDAAFGAAYPDGTWASGPTDDAIILIQEDGTLDFSTMTGWGIFYNWNTGTDQAPAWYFCCIGYSYLTKME